MPRRQCKTCPWRIGADPHAIPHGYCETKHRGLESTIRTGLESMVGGLRIMACHYSQVGKERPCVGWLANQLGPGNNIGLRLAVMSGRIDGDYTLRGKQHERFEDTLP